MESLIAIYPELMPQSAFDAGLSPFRCDNCTSHISKRNELNSPLWHENIEVECSLCGHVNKGSQTVIPTSAPLLKTAVAQDMVWFHATYVDDWFEKISNGRDMEEEDGYFLYIHVGSEDAAREIANHKYFDGYPSRDELKIMLYQVRLKAGAALSSRIVNDNETWRDFGSVTDGSKSAIGGDAVRYLNRWESPGSISLLVDASKLELVSVKQIHNPHVPSAKVSKDSKIAA